MAQAPCVESRNPPRSPGTRPRRPFARRRTASDDSFAATSNGGVSGATAGLPSSVSLRTPIDGRRHECVRRSLARSVAAAFAIILTASVSAAPSLADALDDAFAQAADHYAHQRWADACQGWNTLLAEHPDDPRASAARFYYGEALRSSIAGNRRASSLPSCSRREPNHRFARPALFRSGEAAWLAGDTAAAARDLESFRRRYPNDDLNAYAISYLAEIESQAHRSEAAETLFLAAIEQFPTGPCVESCRLGLAATRDELGQVVLARGGYRSVAEARGPLAGRALLKLAGLENAQGDHAAALAALDDLDALPSSASDPSLAAPARLARGFALYKLGRYAEAEPLLAKLAAEASLQVEAGYWLGMSQRRGAMRRPRPKR